MPKTAIDYKNTIIYKIQHMDIPELLYVGSTTDYTRRKCEHKRNCGNANSKAYNLKLYTMIRANGGWDAFKMIQFEAYPCENKREAEMREDCIMQEMKANKETIKVKGKAYRNANKELINAKKTCACGCKDTQANKARHMKTNKHIKWLETQQQQLEEPN